MADGRDYWKRRSLEDKKRSINASEDFINKYMKRQFKEALKEIKEDLNQLYEKTARGDGISLHDAKRRLSAVDFRKVDFEALTQYAIYQNRELKKKRDSLPEAVAAIMEKRHAAYEKQIRDMSKRGYASHLELMEMQMEKAVLDLSDAQQVNMYRLIEDQYRDGYFRGVYEIQHGTGIGWDFTEPDRDTVRKAITKSWSSRNFSEAIWGEQKDLANTLKQSVTVGLIRGESMDQMTKRLTGRLDVSASNARRLVRTETAYIHEQSTLDAYAECGVTKYQFLATLDRRTSSQCRKLDMKTFDVKEAAVGVNYPPMHPNCRSTTVPYTDAVTERAARDVSGKYYTVPSNLSYQKWYDALPDQDRERMERQNTQERNASSDRDQYERYRKTLGKAAGSMKQFLELKYGDEKGFSRLQKEYKEESYIQKFRERIRNGEVNLTVQRKKQEEHTQGTKAWKNRFKQAYATLDSGKPITPQSFLYKDMDVDELVKDYAGKGILDYSLGSGTVKEYVAVEKPIGKYYNKGRKKYVETSRICILYNNKGVHVFAVKEV